MTTKRFIASDMSRALKKVREELGPDAIILSSKRADKGVEIIATLDDTAPSPEQAAKKRFAASFDDELDQPFASDTEWEAHHQAQRIAANTRVAAVAAPESIQAELELRANQARAKNTQSAAPNRAPQAAVATQRGSVSQQQRFSESTSANAERLADEIQVAHERMLAAKGMAAEKNAHGQMEQHDYRGSAYAAAPRYQADPFPQDRYETPRSRETEHQMAQNRQVASFEQQVRARGLDDAQTADQNKQLHSLYDEIAEMRMLLEEQLWQKNYAPQGEASRLSGRARQLATQLEQLGLSQALIKELLVCADDNERLPNCWRKALAMLARRLPVDTRDPIEQGGTFAFVGPTGVGKTTTVAKLAARYVLNHGRGKVAIVTTDTYRVGAHDQLKALGRILQVPVRSIEGEHQLNAVLSSLKQYELVLVDTAGFRQGDPKQAQQEALLDACPGVQRVLVLAANSQQQILKASLHAYGNSPLRGCIFTKLDECASLGEAFGAICSNESPVLYTAAGQEIPDDIHVVSSSDLIAQAVKLARQYEGHGQSQSALTAN
ncbi:MAG TPA: flagellar biosynthesis protein FlhF [Marinagarivorans sp.]